jgi:pimeloyl-ACP methyl ester carboxylesterase
MGGYDQSLLLARTIGEAGYRYIAVSRPGYLGRPLRAGRTPEEQADLYADMLDALGIREAAVMAVSGRGPSAIHFALRHKERCWGLVFGLDVQRQDQHAAATVVPDHEAARPLALVRWLHAPQDGADLERAASRSILDPVVRARTLRARSRTPSR